MIQTGCRFSFQMETLQVSLGRPLTKANDFQRYVAVETFLSRTIHNPLSTAAHFL